MHKSVHDYVAKWVKALDLKDKSVLEIGSLNVNGTVRDLFTGEYFGVDKQAGSGVDAVIKSVWELADIPEVDIYTVVLYLETMEHDLTFHKTLDVASVVTSVGGYFFLTTRGIGFPKHDYPKDYYRFTKEAIADLMEEYGFEIIDISDDPYPGHPGVLCVARKK